MTVQDLFNKKLIRRKHLQEEFIRSLLYECRHIKNDKVRKGKKRV
jgi:hypothetical protein